MERIVADRYRVGSKLGSGAFGQIYLATDIYTKEQVAIKFESVRSPDPRLHFESEVYSVLRGGTTVRFPKCRWHGRWGNDYALVMELLGTNLEKLLKSCGGRFSLKTVLMLGAQMIKQVEYVHSKSYIHRDIKPDNFAMGIGKHATKVYMIDFGIGKKYRDSLTHAHIPYRDGLRVVGSALFASINSHNGVELSRRDDLETLGYTLVYMLTGSLPWMSIRGSSPEAHFRRIRDMKVSTSIEELCQGCPSEFRSYFHYIHRIRFEEAPEYAYLDKLLKNAFVRHGYRYDYRYDWIKPKASSVPRCTCTRHSHQERGFKSKIGKAIKGFFGAN